MCTAQLMCVLCSSVIAKILSISFKHWLQSCLFSEYKLNFNGSKYFFYGHLMLYKEKLTILTLFFLSLNFLLKVLTSFFAGGRNVAVYGKYGSLPSITQHDFSFFLNSGSGIDPMFSHSEYLKELINQSINHFGEIICVCLVYLRFVIVEISERTEYAFCFLLL